MAERLQVINNIHKVIHIYMNIPVVDKSKVIHDFVHNLWIIMFFLLINTIYIVFFLKSQDIVDTYVCYPLYIETSLVCSSTIKSQNSGFLSTYPQAILGKR